MVRLRYVVYYKYEGRTKARPLDRRKTDEEVAHALSCVKPDLRHMLEDDTADVLVEKRDGASIIVNIATQRSEDDARERLERCLTGLDLYGQEVK